MLPGAWRQLARYPATWVVVGLLVAGAGGWVWFSRAHFVHPSDDEVGEVDAVVVLAGGVDRLEVAQALAASVAAPVLAISNPGGEDRAGCERDVPYEVLCFDSEAARVGTQGEARAIGRLAEERNWQRIAVVTSDYHQFRAGVLVRRCTEADVAMVSESTGLGWRRVLEEQTKLLASLVVERGC